MTRFMLMVEIDTKKRLSTIDFNERKRIRIISTGILRLSSGAFHMYLNRLELIPYYNIIIPNSEFHVTVNGCCYGKYFNMAAFFERRVSAESVFRTNDVKLSPLRLNRRPKRIQKFEFHGRTLNIYSNTKMPLTCRKLNSI